MLDAGTVAKLTDLVAQSRRATIGPRTPAGSVAAEQALEEFLSRSKHASDLVSRIGRQLRTNGFDLVKEAISLDFILADIVGGLFDALIGSLGSA